ncbi:helix-turn-helix domain-containing protein [Bacillus massiliigorillae]|uniref:helix-turn-helix domain-containing protein n=1 Tax=Bacillus massiliigorillae TaxID=1243664 RepID=UPI0003A1C4FB|nr:helix-turn-helix transcriptional regulator [Bacillus massiliigorillae]
MANINGETSRRHPPYNKIKAFLVENYISQKEVGLLLAKSPSAINQKLNGTGGDFSLEEARMMSSHFGIPRAYFFEIEVPKKERIVGV